MDSVIGKSYIDGEWVDGEGAEVQNIDPGNKSVIGKFNLCTGEQILRAVDGACEGFKVISKMPVRDRVEILRKTAELVASRFDEISSTLSREGGKLIGEARYETSRCIQALNIASEEAKRLYGEVIPMDSFSVPDLSDRFGFTRVEPLGVIAAITPFNFPLMMPTHKIAPAIAAGNSVVLKPSSDTPFTAALIVKCLLDAGIPKKSISLVYSDGRTASGSLVSSKNVRMVVFTGSTETGKSIAHSAGKNATRVALEMGGKNPLIVMDDADMDAAIAGTVRGGFTHAGQICIATGRVLVHERIHDEFVRKIAKRVSARKVGYQMNSETEMGPLINEASLLNLRMYVEDARASGLDIVTGGEDAAVDGCDGYYYKPTIVVGVGPDDRIAVDEIFGPVLPIIRFKSIDEAIEIANSIRYGLSSAVYTKSMAVAFRCIESLESGSVSVNETTLIRADNAPFGGYKESGIGREGLKYAIREMTETKMVYWKKA